MSEAVQEAIPEPQPEETQWEWAIVEIFGHRKHAGRIREEERFGAKMLRIDIPKTNNEGTLAKSWTSHFYGGASIFSMTLTDERTALLANKPNSWDRPQRLSYAHDDLDEQENEPDDGLPF